MVTEAVECTIKSTLWTELCPFDARVKDLCNKTCIRENYIWGDCENLDCMCHYDC